VVNLDTVNGIEQRSEVPLTPGGVSVVTACEAGASPVYPLLVFALKSPSGGRRDLVEDKQQFERVVLNIA